MDTMLSIFIKNEEKKLNENGDKDSGSNTLLKLLLKQKIKSKGTNESSYS